LTQITRHRFNRPRGVPLEPVVDENESRHLHRKRSVHCIFKICREFGRMERSRPSHREPTSWPSPPEPSTGPRPPCSACRTRAYDAPHLTKRLPLSSEPRCRRIDYLGRSASNYRDHSHQHGADAVIKLKRLDIAIEHALRIAEPPMEPSGDRCYLKRSVIRLRRLSMCCAGF
jgi:hypothetical protein